MNYNSNTTYQCEIAAFKGSSYIDSFQKKPSLLESEIIHQSKTIDNCNIVKIETLCTYERTIRGIINIDGTDYRFRAKISLDDFTPDDYTRLIKMIISRIRQGMPGH